MKLETLAERAVSGDREALAELTLALEAPVFRLSLRILGAIGDAEDATQDILVKVITHLSEFDGRSALTTWVHRIAVRYLLQARKSRAEERALDPAAFAALLGVV
jgi:RNA polymerase sigma factor (sigma-70 family)